MKKYLIIGLLLAAVVCVPAVSQASTLSDLTARLGDLIAQVQSLLAGQPSESQLAAVTVEQANNARSVAFSALNSIFQGEKATKALYGGSAMCRASKVSNPGVLSNSLTVQPQEEFVVAYEAGAPQNLSLIYCNRYLTAGTASTDINQVKYIGTGDYSGRYVDLSPMQFTATYSGNGGTNVLRADAAGTYIFHVDCSAGSWSYSTTSTVIVPAAPTPVTVINSQISLAAPTVATVNLTQGQAITAVYYNVKNTGNVPINSNNFRVRVTRSYAGTVSQGSSSSDITAVASDLAVGATRGPLTYQPITPPSGTTSYVVKLQGLKNVGGVWSLVGNEVRVTYNIAPAATVVNQGTIALTSVSPISVTAGNSYIVNYRLNNTGTAAWAASTMKAVLTTSGSATRENVVTAALSAGSSTNGQFSLTTATTDTGTRTHQLYLYRKSGSTWAPISNPINVTVNIAPAPVERTAVSFLSPTGSTQFQPDNIITVTGQLSNTSTGNLTLQPNAYKLKLDVQTGTLVSSPVVYTNTSSPISNTLTVGQAASKTFQFYSISFSPTAATRTYYLRLSVLKRGTDGEYRPTGLSTIRSIGVVAAPTLSQVAIEGNPASVVHGTSLSRVTWQTTGSVPAVDVYVCIQGGACLRAYQSLSNSNSATNVLVGTNVPAGSTAYIQVRKAGESLGTSVKANSSTFSVTAPLTRNAVFSALSITAGNLPIYSGTTLRRPLFTGEQATVNFNARNTGNTTWVAGGANPYSLGSQAPRDNSTWGLLRYKIPGSVGKNPGQDWVGSFTITAPQTPGAYNFQWQMLQEGIAWFGPMLPTSPLAIRVISRPSVSISGINSGWISGEAKTVSWNSQSFDSTDQILVRLCQIANNQPIENSCIYLKGSGNSVILANDGSESVTIPSDRVIGTIGRTHRLYINKNGDGAYRGNGESTSFTVLPVPAPTIVDGVDFNRTLAQVYFNYWEAKNYQGKKDFVSCEIKAWSNKVTGVKTRTNLDAKNMLVATGKNLELCSAVGSCPRVRGYFVCTDSRSNAQVITAFGRNCASTAAYPNDPATISANANCGTDL